MIKSAISKILSCTKGFLLLFVIFLVSSCDRKFYHGTIAVEQHSWQLKKIDTLFRIGRYKPSATWYNRHDGLYYIDNDHEFPYPYRIGTYIGNFDRK